MSIMTSQRMPLAVAEKLAERIRRKLESSCERIEIAGSIRRRCETIGDIELLAIAKPHPDLFGDATERTLLDDRLDQLLKIGELKAPPPEKKCNGPKWKRYDVGGMPGVRLDLFIVTPQTWGVQMMIRTGPADFSHLMVMQQRFGGYLHKSMKISGGRLWRLNRGTFERLATPEERDVFKAMELAYLDPCNRVAVSNVLNTIDQRSK